MPVRSGHGGTHVAFSFSHWEASNWLKYLEVNSLFVTLLKMPSCNLWSSIFEASFCGFHLYTLSLCTVRLDSCKGGECVVGTGVQHHLPSMVFWSMSDFFKSKQQPLQLTSAKTCPQFTRLNYITTENVVNGYIYHCLDMKWPILDMSFW